MPHYYLHVSLAFSCPLSKHKVRIKLRWGKNFGGENVITVKLYHNHNHDQVR